MGKTVIIVSPDKHLGGLSSGGLGFTDTGNKAVIGGLAREFYHRVYQHYQKPEAWNWERREQFGAKGQGTVALDGENRTMWIFEPHVAEQVFEDFIRGYNIPVVRNEWLNRKTGVKKSGASIVSIKTLSGKTYTGKMFIDATYEGDLMAAAGVSYHVGRESKAQYGEQWNGVQTGVLHHRHHFGAVKDKISPYWIPGDPKSGVLPRISTAPPGEYGAADNKLQAYCFRMCLTDHAENRVPLPKPAGYDPKQYELMLRIFQAGWRETFQKFDRIPNHKTDTNNHGPFSTDNIRYNYDYPEASYERRRQIIREHEQYQKGWLYFIANDPRVPKDVQDEFRKWGLAKDEFKDNGAWPHQIDVREARRMVGAYVMTENELLKKRPTPDSVGMGSYGIDSHNIQRYIIAVFQSPGSNALALADGVKKTMGELKGRFPSDLDYAVVLDTTLPVTEGIREIVQTLVEAMILVILVVFLFLQNWRATLIPAIAVPVSLVGTFAVFPLLGFSINTLSLFGLVLAIGLVVDDAIVVVEAVEHQIEKGLSPRDATISAMKDVS